MLPVPRLPGRRSHRRPVAAAADEPDLDPTEEPVEQPVAGSGPAVGPSLGELVAGVATDAGDRRAQLRALAGALARAVRGAGRGAGRSAGRNAGRGAGDGVRGLGRVLADAAADAAPRIPVRDAVTLRSHHPGRGDDEVAEALIRAAARTTAAFGAGVGGLAAMEFAAPPTYLAAPVQLAAETLAVVAVEVKLVAELHELYDQPAYGTGSQRGTAYLTSWIRQRALDPVAGRTGLGSVLGHASKRELQAVLMRRMGRGVGKLVPFLAGAVAGAEINRRATRSLGGKLAAELRARARPPMSR